MTQQRERKERKKNHFVYKESWTELKDEDTDERNILRLHERKRIQISKKNYLI